MSARALVTRYASFAVIATIANIASQCLSLKVYHGDRGLMISVLTGTSIGFLVKYALDKYFIFFDKHGSATRELTKIILYGVTAIVTTAVFWSSEFGFWSLWHTAFAKYTGALIGLSIGYFAKYLLDRRFVFVEAGFL